MPHLEGSGYETVTYEEIDKGEVLRYLGYKPGVHALDASVEEQIAQASAVVPGCCGGACDECRFPLEGEKRDVKRNGLTGWKGYLCAFARLSYCRLTAPTLGDGLEQKIRAAQAQSTLYATVMDCCASVAVEQYCDLYETKLREQYTKQGKFLTGRYSPGYGDFPD